MMTLLQFMQLLGKDAALADEYHDSREAVIDRFGLDPESRRVLLEKDYEAIKRMTGLRDGEFRANSTIKAYNFDDCEAASALPAKAA